MFKYLVTALFAAFIFIGPAQATDNSAIQGYREAKEQSYGRVGHHKRRKALSAASRESYSEDIESAAELNKLSPAAGDKDEADKNTGIIPDNTIRYNN